MVEASWRRYSGVDLSSSKRPGVVIFTLAIQPVTGLRVPLDIRRGQWSSTETARQILAVHRDFHPDAIMVEDNAYQESLLDWMRSMRDAPRLPLTNFTTGGNKWDPEVGLPSLEVEFSNHMWQVYRPSHGLECECSWCVWYDETMAHPTAATTDCVMACWMARECAVRRGRVGRFKDLKKVQGALSRPAIDGSTLRAFG